VTRPRADLSDTQRTIALLVAEGLTDEQIAAVTGITPDGVSYHLKRIVTLWQIDRCRNLRVQIAVRVVSAA